MSDNMNVKLTNGTTIALDPENVEKFLGEFIDVFLKPLYLQNNDWNKAIKTSIMEIERISSIYHISKGQSIDNMLKMIDTRLAKDISELPGVDKIEILFENIEDIVEDIHTAIKMSSSQEEARLTVAKLAENLNLFEISELLIHFAKKMKE